MSKKWDPHKEEILRLYIVENLTLDHVIDHMMQTYGFDQKYAYSFSDAVVLLTLNLIQKIPLRIPAQIMGCPQIYEEGSTGIHQSPRPQKRIIARPRLWNLRCRWNSAFRIPGQSSAAEI